MPAPGRLALVQDFVNSVDLEDGPEEFATAEGLRRFLLRRNLITAQDEVSEGDRRRAIDFREALRALALANNGFTLNPSIVRTLNSFGERLPLLAQFDSTGEARLVPVRRSVDGALASILATVWAAMEEGSWARLKACQSDRCHWVFYDHSKNRRSHWCSMSTCGSRSKSRVYLERRRTA